jgi:transposase
LAGRLKALASTLRALDGELRQRMAKDGAGPVLSACGPSLGVEGHAGRRWRHGPASQPELDATNWRAELAIRFGVILRKVWGGSRTWAGARAQSVLLSVWRTCWQQGRSALDFLSQLLRGTPVALALPL